MNPQKLNLNLVQNYVENHIGDFHKKRLDSIHTLKLGKLLKRKNPYLYKAKNVLTASEIINGFVDALCSSNEETLFGNWLEGLAIYVNQLTYGGRKSSTEGIDLEFFPGNNKHVLVSIKSGPNWCNHSQKKKLIDYFNKAKKTLGTSSTEKKQIVCIEGCCYGKMKTGSENQGTHLKYCGQKFWEFITGDPDVYLSIIEPLGFKAMEKYDSYLESSTKIKNLLVREFTNDYCTEDGSIDWQKLVRFNSEKLD